LDEKVSRLTRRMLARCWYQVIEEHLMNGTAGLVICCAFTACVAQPAFAQLTVRDTHPPAVTADSESWYQSGVPITYEGSYYYPAGPKVHFIPSEMVRTGDFRGIPLYARTTIEPYSIVFVPVAGGMMQPYERRRDGELAGTEGSSAASFPIAPASDSSLDDDTGPAQAPGPPVFVGFATSREEQLSSVPQPAGTSGVARTVETTPPASGSRVPVAPRIRPRADSPNGIFIQYENARWFSSGPPVEFDSSRYVRSGQMDGFPVYRDRTGTGSTIYVPVARDATGLLAPYTKRDR
jgi:hypothetical protein